MKNYLYVGLFVLLVSLSSAAHAAVVGIGDFTPNGGGVYDMTTGTGSVNDTGIESFVGLVAGTLDTLQPKNARHGSALMDTITISTGDIFSFDWAWTSNESSNSFYNDFAFTSLSLDGAVVIADTYTPDGTTGSFSWTATTSGMLTYGVGVMDAYDYYVSSYLTVSNISVGPIPNPEPTTLLLMGVGIVGLIERATRKKLKKNIVDKSIGNYLSS